MARYGQRMLGDTGMQGGFFVLRSESAWSGERSAGWLIINFRLSRMLVHSLGMLQSREVSGVYKPSSLLKAIISNHHKRPFPVHLLRQ